MLKNNTYFRIFVTVVLGILCIYYPSSIFLVIIPAYYFGNYIESILFGIMLDALYGTNGAVVYTSGVFIVFVCVELIKRRLRI